LFLSSLVRSLWYWNEQGFSKLPGLRAAAARDFDSVMETGIAVGSGGAAGAEVTGAVVAVY